MKTAFTILGYSAAWCFIGSLISCSGQLPDQQRSVLKMQSQESTKVRFSSPKNHYSDKDEKKSELCHDFAGWSSDDECDSYLQLPKTIDETVRKKLVDLVMGMLGKQLEYLAGRVNTGQEKMVTYVDVVDKVTDCEQTGFWFSKKGESGYKYEINNIDTKTMEEANAKIGLPDTECHPRIHLGISTVFEIDDRIVIIFNAPSEQWYEYCSKSKELVTTQGHGDTPGYHFLVTIKGDDYDIKMSRDYQEIEAECEKQLSLSK